MKEQSLKFLYSRLKRKELSKEQTESKVCQEIFISKIGSNKKLFRKVAFKGGLIIDSLSHGQRGFTKDIDFDFVKYPLSDEGLTSFVDELNICNPFSNIHITIDSIDNLRHKNYRGKRLLLLFIDNESTFKLTIDVGVFLPLIKRNTDIEYRIAFGDATRIMVNPIERMIAEKLSTFAIYGTDNTRDKDLFDAFFLITSFSSDKSVVKKILIGLLVTKNHYFKNFEIAIEYIKQTLLNNDYMKFLKSSKKNWTNHSIEDINSLILEYISLL